MMEMNLEKHISDAFISKFNHVVFFANEITLYLYNVIFVF